MDEVADLMFDPVIGLWAILSIPFSGLSFLITYPQPISFFHLFLCIMTIAWLGVGPTVFKDCVESSIDWKEEVDYSLVFQYTLLGLIGVFFTVFLASQILGSVLPTGFWVPTKMYLLSQTLQVEAGGFYAYTTDAFATLFSVVPGEESMKANFSVLFHAYQNQEWASDLRFALQPAIVAGTCFWGIEHVIAGQNPLGFWLPATLAGFIMNECSALSGSYLANYTIHTGYNLSLLTINLLMGGYLKITPI